MLRRAAESPQLGVVGRFLTVAPMLLHGGRSIQTLPLPVRYDWWAECVENDLISPLDRVDPRPMASPSKLPEPTAPSADAGDWWADMIGTKLNSATGPLAPVCPANISQTTPDATIAG
jgi:hypothetical protein